MNGAEYGEGWWRGNGGRRPGESTEDELDWDCVQFLGRLDCLGFKFPAVGEGDLSLLRDIRTGSGIHLLSYSVVTRFLSWGMKWSVCEVNHWHPTSTKCKNEWSCTSARPVCPHGVDRVSFTVKFVCFGTSGVGSCCPVTMILPSAGLLASNLMCLVLLIQSLCR